MEIDIKALESAIADAINHPSELLGVCLTVKEAQSVLAMLKEKEPKLIEFNFVPVCSACGKPIADGDGVKFCCYCGQAVKWK